MRVRCPISLLLSAVAGLAGCSSSSIGDAGNTSSGSEAYCIAAGQPCSVEAPCCTGSCVDGFSDAGRVCGTPPSFWIDGGIVQSGQPVICGTPGSGQANSQPNCGCTGNSDCISNSCVGSLCCGIPGGNLANSPLGCGCNVNSDCVSGSCSFGVCTNGAPPPMASSASSSSASSSGGSSSTTMTSTTTTGSGSSSSGSGGSSSGGACEELSQGCNPGLPCCAGLTCIPDGTCAAILGNACFDDAGPCAQGTICCPWAGGACVPNGDGGCSGASGYECADPTAEGVCPNLDFP